MASMTFSNPGVGKLFQGLGDVLAGPDPNTLIQADMNRVRRDGMLVDNSLTAAKLGVIQRQERAMTDLAAVLGDPTLTQTPEGRANLMSILSQTDGGLQYGPGFATGAASFTDPNFVESDSDFSRILAGTGVQGWTQTPEGQNRDLANKLAITNLDNQNDMAMALAGVGSGGSKTPLDVGPTDVTNLMGQLEDAIYAQFPGAEIDPQTLQAMVARAGQVYQTTRNASTAVRQAIVEAQLANEGKSDGFLFGWGANPGTVRVGDSSALGDVLAGPVAAPNMTPDPAQPIVPGPSVPGPTQAAQTTPAAPAAPADTARAAVPGPAVHQNADGSTFIVHQGRPVTIVDGYQVRAPNGQVLVWRDGQWNPA